MNKSFLKEIEKKLTEVEQKKKLILAVGNFFLVSGCVSLVFLFLSLVESELYFSSGIKTILLILFASSIVFIGGYLVILPLVQSRNLLLKKDLLKTAGEIGKEFPDIHDDLLNSMQLLSETNERSNYSESLIEAAFQTVYGKAKFLDFKKIVNSSYILKMMKLAFVPILLGIICFTFISSIQSGFVRLVNYNKEYLKPARFQLYISPGNLEVTKGDDISIEISVSGEIPNSITLRTKSIEQSEFSEHKILKDSTGQFLYSITNVSSSFKYFAEEGNIYSDIYDISVIDPPTIRNFDLTLTPPAYSRLPELVQRNNGSVTGLKGSLVKLDIEVSKNIKAGSIIFSDSSKKVASIDKEKVYIEFRLNKDESYFMNIEDSLGNRNPNKIIYTLKVIADEFPVLEVLQPESDLKVTGAEQIPIALKISDDYGFSKLILHHKLSASSFEEVGENFQSKQIPLRKGIKEDEVFYAWNLADLYLAVEDVVSYYFEIFDNDNVSGPKSTKSSLFTLRVPSLDEIFTESEVTQETAESELEETLQEAKKLNEDLQKLNNELKKNEKDLSWEEKESIEDAMKKFEEMENKVDEIQQKLSEMQKDLQDNNLLSEETLEKYLELQDLLDQLSSEEMKKAMQKMQEQLQNMDRRNAQNNLEDFKMDEEAFQKSLERTVNLLKRIQIEQKMDEVAKRLEDIQQKQDDLQQQTKNGDNSDKQQLQDMQSKQNQVSEDLKKLQDEMEKLQGKMSEFSEMPNEEMQKMMDEFSKQNNEELSEKAEQQMMQQMMQQAQQNQKKLSQNMENMQQMMMQMQQQMMMQNQMMVMAKMMKMINELLSLSKEQEQLERETKNLSPLSQEIKKNAQRQNEISQGLQGVMKEMSELSQQTFAITPEMGRALGEAQRSMYESTSAMGERNNQLSAMKQKGSMASLNEAAQLMQSSMSGMMNQSQSGGGMMSLMQQMQQLSQQQMGLNQMTQMLQQGSLSPQQQGELRRLAQQQQMIQKSLEQLNKEAKESGKSKSLAGNLEKIINEMKEVVTGMETEKLSDDLVKQQERILSKMLDTQRSINERDYEKKRESITGKNFLRESPPEVVLSSEEGKNKLREELIKAVREGYSKDYEALIRKYFEALEKEGKTN